jgi:amino acid permease
VGKINAGATAGLFLGFFTALVFGFGGVDPKLLLASNLVAAAPALPAIAQTMTYAEAIPTVVDMCRGSRVKVRRVLALGSLGPALMYALWLAVTLGRASLADFAAGGGDLAAKILADGGPLGYATAAIATCASVSTLIGCYLALSRFHADTFKLNLSRRNLKLVSLTVLPSLLVSMKGPEMYHLMIKFAGTGARGVPVGRDAPAGVLEAAQGGGEAHRAMGSLPGRGDARERGRHGHRGEVHVRDEKRREIA